MKRDRMGQPRHGYPGRAFRPLPCIYTCTDTCIYNICYMSACIRCLALVSYPTEFWVGPIVGPLVWRWTIAMQGTSLYYLIIKDLCQPASGSGVVAPFALIRFLAIWRLTCFRGLLGALLSGYLDGRHINVWMNYWVLLPWSALRLI